MRKHLIQISLAGSLLVLPTGCGVLAQMHNNAVQGDNARKASGGKQPRFVYAPALAGKVKKVVILSVYGPDRGAISGGAEYASYDNQPSLDRAEATLVDALGKGGWEVLPLADSKAALTAGFDDEAITEGAKLYNITHDEMAARIKKNKHDLAIMMGEDDPEHKARMEEMRVKNQKIRDGHPIGDKSGDAVKYGGAGQLLFKTDVASANTYLIEDPAPDFGPRRLTDPDGLGVFSRSLQAIAGRFARKLGADGAILVAIETKPVYATHANPKAGVQLAFNLVDADGALAFADRLDAISPDDIADVVKPGWISNLKGTTGTHYSDATLSAGMTAATDLAVATLINELKSGSESPKRCKKGLCDFEK